MKYLNWIPLLVFATCIVVLLTKDPSVAKASDKGETVYLNYLASASRYGNWDLLEFQVKGHCYLSFNHGFIHAQHCPCFKTK